MHLTNPSNLASLHEVIAVNEMISNSTDLESLLKLQSKYGHLNHPQIAYDFGRALSIKGDKSKAKELLLEGASYGLRHPCILYDSPLIDSIGQCMFDLVTEYPIRDISIARNVTTLSYIYLSRCITLYHREAHDSYRSRAMLFKFHKYPMLPNSIIAEFMGLSVLIDPFIISDFYYAAHATNSPFRQSGIKQAIEAHAWLEDISVGGRSANKYSLLEMVELGENRHLKLFEILESEYMKGKFDVTTEELSQLNHLNA
ncbi:MAG TPA: hypothetical protein VJU78_03285 [Chitinophagaceae bacterium]|nr:hypothetical protein [Chitinophagaceae bacterium]